jgi:hypothetical protein
MFSQVVATLLRVTERYAERWLAVQGSHEVPVYGFERIVDPPPLTVDVRRLLDEFGRGRHAVGDAWAQLLEPETDDLVEGLSAQAGELAAWLASGGAEPADGTAAVAADFAFPDETWARVIYDVVLAARARTMPLERLVAALVPLYFGRVASLVIETGRLTTDEAEPFVERQARAFELLKPSLVKRWLAATAAGRPAARRRPA